MAARDMTLQVVVKLRDELGSGLNAAMSRIAAWGAKAKSVFDRIGSTIGSLSAKFGALGLGASVGLADGLKSATEYDAKLRDVAITYGLVGRAVEDFVKKAGGDTQKLAKDTGQLSAKLMDVRSLLAAANVDQQAADVMVRPIGRAATAAGADAADITKTAIAAFQNSGLAPELLGTALAHMITGGKLGSFELKNMAQHYPSLLAALANLGVKGMGGIDTATAMMQISKRTAGTEGEAATNMLDFLSGLNSAHTVKRFADKGVDLPGLMANANARGINPVEAVIGKIGKIIDQPKVVEEAMARAKKKGLDPTKTQEEVRKAVESAVKAAGLGELFVNQQSKMFLMAMLANVEDYKRMKAEIAASNDGITDQDYASRMAGPEGKARMAQENVEQIMRRFGEAITGIYERIGGVAEKLQTMIRALDEISPKIVDTAVQLGSLASAVTGAVFAFKMLGGGGAGAAAAAGGAAASGGIGTAGAAAGGAAAGWLARAVARAGGWFAGSGAGVLGAFAFASEALQRAFPTTKAGMAYRLDAGPIDIADYERSIRAQREWQRDPEAARGRAMMGRGGVSLPASITRDAPHKQWFSIGEPNLSFESVTNSKAPNIPWMIGAAFAGLLKMAGAKPAEPKPQRVEVDSKVTVEVVGPGVVTSSSTTAKGAGVGDRGQTVGRP